MASIPKLRSLFLSSSSLMLSRLFRPTFNRDEAKAAKRPAVRRALRKVARRAGPVTIVAGFALLNGATAAAAQTAPPGLPVDGTFVGGAGRINQTSPTLLNIVQTTDRGVIDWRAFTIADGHQVSIDNGQGATLNRVMGGQLSRIDGLLTGTGSRSPARIHSAKTSWR